MRKVAFHTLGCKVNQYETEAMLELFKKDGYEEVKFEELADVYVVNTCTVTSLSDKKCRQMIRRAHKSNEEAVIVVVGCYVQNDPETVKAIEGVNVILGTNEKKDIVAKVEEYKKEKNVIEVVDDLKQVNVFEELEIENTLDKTRAFLKIQEGCNQFCSYCIIPYVRGRIRSRDIDNIIREAKRLVENGFKEIVLTGIHVASYGKDLEEEISLLDVIEKVHSIEGLVRLRLSSIEPRIITEEFAKRLSELEKVCDHFHLSLQSGSEKVLKEMNRKYTKEEYMNGVKNLRKYMPDVSITTDIIVGFPGETEGEFEESLEFAKEVGFSQTHVFAYSKREGTVAAKREDQISNNVKADRSKQMIELTNKSEVEFLNSQIGKVYEVLLEDEKVGHTTNYLKVEIDKSQRKNELVNVKIIGVNIKKNILIGAI
ncbi:MAG: tRNA (N(6)-L-threonylcarbamoyladenosine(37)-C(2))-methylthiotransferase MtaB [Clostridia bacterium]|jgi:threonylcarbamoyladenosine tRNA methylthiotransferase MtaB|nr:tRNA (N(6)-L-threonylcarbamoyladenosine(37)-C(2))-methylthiotransferase MtaB [Clostridia bacterium]